MNFKLIVLVGLGSFLGGILRYLVSVYFQNKEVSGFPWATFSVNIFGCFLIGLAYGYFERENASVLWRIVITSGFLGGFTTFSAFSSESLILLKSDLSLLGVLYILASISLGILATFVGIIIAK
jgi:fluoride exporter